MDGEKHIEPQDAKDAKREVKESFSAGVRAVVG
jgi:hypothetical protein